VIQGSAFAGTLTTGPGIDLSGSTSYAPDIENNSFALTSGLQNATAINLVNQQNPTVSGNTIDNYLTFSSSAEIAISGGSAIGVATVNGNTIYARADRPHYIILIGADVSGYNNANQCCNGAVVHNNVIRGYRYFNPSIGSTVLDTHAILVGYQLNADIQGNDIAGTGYGIVVKGGNGSASYTWTSGIVAFNTIWNLQTSSCLGAIYVKGSSGVPVYNNTVYLGLTDSPSTSNSSCPLETEANSDSGQSGPATNNLFKNNLVAGVDVGTAFTYNAGGSGNAFDYNLYFASNSFGAATTGGGFGYDGTAYYANWAQWKGTGQDAHSLYGNPLFTSPTSGDFTLQAGSPALAAGVYIPGVSTANPPNIGAK
jgi:hypothetical protein